MGYTHQATRIMLFDDQKEIMAAVRAAMPKYKSILLQSPTGSGKTHMATDMIFGAMRKNKRMCMSFPRISLMEQTSKTLTKLGIWHTFIAADVPYDPFAPVILGMEKTMANWIRAGRMPTDIMVFIPDETHYGDKDLDTNIKFFKMIGAWIVGLSATPMKMNGQGLGIWYDHMVKGKSIKWLIANKRLSDYKLFGGKKTYIQRNLSEKELNQALEANNEIIGDCVGEYKKRAMGKLWATRCTSIRQSELIAEAFRNAGVPSVHVDGETPQTERDRIFRALARREIFNVTFVNLLTFGFDLSQAAGIDVCLEGGSDTKPSESLPDLLQLWGRFLRYKPDPAFIHDHVNNHVKHGKPDDDREWTLDSEENSNASADRSTPSRLCPECAFSAPGQPSACPECGYVFEAEGRSVRQVDGELVEIARHEEMKVLKGEYDPRADGLAEFLPPVNSETELESLIRFAQRKGVKNPYAWAAAEFQKKVFDTNQEDGKTDVEGSNV